MKLSRKIMLMLFGGIIFIAIINMISFYLFYNRYFQIYLRGKIEQKESITRDYIDDIIKKQALDDINNIFNDIEVEFEELLDKNTGEIPLDNKSNVDIIVDYLSSAGVNIKYIEEIIPQNYLERVIEDIKDKDSPEYEFFNNLIYMVYYTNILAIILLVIILLIFSKIIISPIEKATNTIKGLKIGRDFEEIEYHKKDEIGLLVDAINNLNKKVNVSESIKNRLLADISHELKTPITSIQTYLEGIQDGVIQLNDTTLNDIIGEMHRLIKLVDEIMAFEKFDAEHLRLDLKKEDLKSITSDIVKQYTQKLQSTNQYIKVMGLNKDILSDRDLYIQILHNIIGNFIKYAGKNTTLTITFGVGYIEFSDDGAGISKKELPFLKEKFYQGNIEKTGNIEDRGIGIGLSIVEKLTKELSWGVELSSDTGKGFKVKLITQTSH